MKPILRYLLGLTLIVVGYVLGLEAIGRWQLLRAAAEEDGAHYMRITDIVIVGYQFPIGPYAAIVGGLCVVLVWLGIRCIIPGRFIRHDAKA